MNARLSASGWIIAVVAMVGSLFLNAHAAPLTSKVEMVVTYNGKDRSVVIELDEVNAPKTCQNFRKLCKSGFYNGTIFHRVIPGYIVQAGDPLSKEPAKRSMWGTGGPGYTLPAELGKPHLKGSLAMARLGDAVNPEKESSGSQFYVALDRIESLDGEYTVFGNVVSGLADLMEIGEAASDQGNVPIDRIVIKRMTVTDEGAAPAPAPASEPAPAPVPDPASTTKMEDPKPFPVPAPAAEEPVRDITPGIAQNPTPSTGNAEPAPSNWPPKDTQTSKPAKKASKKQGAFTKFLKRFW